MIRDIRRHNRILMLAQALTYQNRLRPSAHSQQREGDRAIEFADAEATILSQDARVVSENPYHPEGTTYVIAGKRFNGDERKGDEMGARRVRWATNLPDGTPILIDGVIADVDDETGVVSLSDRAREVIAEVLSNDPRPSHMEQIPVIDLAEEVRRLIQAKHAAGVPVRSPLPKSRVRDTAHETVIQQSMDK